MNLYDIRKQLVTGKSLRDINIRVTYYARVSTDHSDQYNSLKNQNDYFIEMINDNPNWIYIPGYIDRGISGTSDIKRIEFMKMINDAKDNKFDLIITKEISRFSRNTLDSIMYTRKLLEYGVCVLFLNDNINTILPDSELRLTIMASMAQDEIRRLSERVKFGMARSIKNGNILGNNQLYGYKKNKDTGNLEIIEEESTIVKRLYLMYTVENYSINKIAITFNKEKIPTKMNKKWNIATLKRMLINPKYKGYYCGKKSEIIDYMTKKIKINPESEWVMYEDNQKIPPIINEELWNKTQEKINKQNKTINKKTYLFSNKIYCIKDNYPYYRRRECQDDITWLCSNYLKHGKQQCHTSNIREKELYQIIKDIINYLEIKKTKIINILNKTYKNKIKISEELINNKIIEKIINKITSYNTNPIILTIYLDINKVIDINKEYIFSRGYNKTSTKRYKQIYKVHFTNCYLSNNVK